MLFEETNEKVSFKDQRNYQYEEKLKDQLYENLTFLKSLGNKEYLLFQKFETLHDFYKNRKIKSSDISSVKTRILNKDDVYEIMNKKDNKVEIVNCSDSKEELNTWMILRHFISSMDYKSSIGRTTKFYLKINGKIAGLIGLNSDFMTISVRDKHIGWTVANINHDHKLNHTILGGIIVPTQPFGFSTTGGKFVTLMCLSNPLISDWENRYKDKIVVFNTTSLYGAQSQYNGMNKYFKILGESKGNSVSIYPSQEIYLENHKYMYEIIRGIEQKIIFLTSNSKNKNDIYLLLDKILNFKKNEVVIKYQIQKKNLEDLKSLLSEDVLSQVDFSFFYEFNMCSIRPNFKTHLINLFYKYTNFTKYLKEKNPNQETPEFTNNFKRGIIYSEFYTNAREFLRNEIKEEDLIPRTDWDFDRNDPNSIFEYWKNKYGVKRYEKMLREDKDNPKLSYIHFFDTPITKLINKYGSRFYSSDKKIIYDMFYDFMRFTEENTEFSENRTISLF